MNIPALHTERLALIPLQDTDAETLHRVYQTEGALRYFPNTSAPPLEKVRKFIAHQNEHWEKFGYGNWGILPNGEKQIIGWAGLQFLPELKETEVGFLIDKPFWGKGYGTEIARAALQFGFKNLNLDHLVALVHPDNLASRRVIQKCGMTYAETIRIWGIELMRHTLKRESAS